MELSSPENGFEGSNNILKENGPCLADDLELDPSYMVQEEENGGDYAFGDLEISNNFCGEHEHETLPKDFSYFDFCASPQQLLSPLQTGFDENVILSEAQLFAGDDEGRLLSSPKEYYQQGEEVSEMQTEKLCTSVENDEIESEHIHNVKNSPDDSRNYEMVVSDHLIPPSEKKNYVPKTSAKGLSPSPRNLDLHKNYRRRNRSVSKSPIRRKEHMREHCRERSRSRSPHRHHYRRSPRKRRYSPRRRSPSSTYHYRHWSPKRRHWSHPHSRSTGIGKPGRNLFIAGFSFLTTERDLERKFSRFGRVRDVRIVRNKRSGDSRGFGFLSLETDEEADAAIRALDKTEWNGRIVLVEKSKPH